jgi:hypothetical protein
MAVTDPGTRVTLGSNDPLTGVDAAWVAANIDGIIFSRNWNETNRALFDSGTTNIGQYVNFTTMTYQERTQWSAQYGDAQIDAYLLLDGAGDPYNHINGNSEYLCDFTNTDWLDFRLATIPGWDIGNKLSTTNIDYLSLDLCPLYPVDNLIGTQGNPFADADTWKANMLAAVGYIRTNIHASILLLCNGLREFVGVDGFTSNPGSFDTYDGTDLIVPGTYADAATIEAGIEYPSQGVKWLYVLRALYRASVAGITGAAWKADTSSEPMGADEIQRRVNNFVSHALIYLPDYTVFNARTSVGFSPYPIQTFPENGINLGTPNEAVNANFTSHATPTAGLITRTFTGGDAEYVVLFNYDTTPAVIPTAYQTGYEQVRPTGYVEVVDSVTSAALVTAPVGTTLAAGDGMLLQPQAGTLTVTAGSLELLTGECTLYFGVGETGMLLDTGEFSVGHGKAEVLPAIDFQDGDAWEVAVIGKDQPGDRSDRSALEYTPTTSGAQEIGSGGQGRWVRTVIRSRSPKLHRIGAAELHLRFEDDRG